MLFQFLWTAARMLRLAPAVQRSTPIRKVVRGEDARADLEAEIRFHLEARARILLEEGVSPETAMSEARERGSRDARHAGGSDGGAASRVG